MIAARPVWPRAEAAMARATGSTAVLPVRGFCVVVAVCALLAGWCRAAEPPAGAAVDPDDPRLPWQATLAREQPERRLHLPLLERRSFSTFGWIDAGLGANAWGTPFNGVVTFADRSWQGQVNQLYLANERAADAEAGEWDWGARVDLLLGTDSIFTTARGLDAWPLQAYGVANAASWAFSKDYGLAMPQLYLDVARGDLTLRLGHFYGILGYEQVPAVGNFFYTHCFSMQYSPFTFTGVMGTWKPADGVTIHSAVHTGWNNFLDPMPMSGPWAILNPGYPGAASTAGYLGGVTLESDDRSQSLAIGMTTGNEATPLGSDPASGSLVGNRSLITTVYTNRLTERLTYVFENDAAWQFNSGAPSATAGQQPGLAQWYSFNQYAFWTFSDRWLGGVRLEYFRDNNGYIVVAPLRNYSQAGNPGYYSGGFAGNFWELTLGLNYRPNRNWMIRPEVRYDWFTPDAGVTRRPYGPGLGQGIGESGSKLGQFYAGCDAIMQF